MSPVGGGFAVAIATLMIERYVATDSAGFGPHLHLFVDLAKSVQLNGRRAIEDGRIRQQIARNYAMRAGLDSINVRARLMMQAGMMPGPEGSLNKLVAVRSRQKLSELAIDLQGSDGFLFDEHASQKEDWASIGGLFVHVDITDEQSVLDGYAKARAAHGQERVCVHCAMTSRRGKTLAYDKETGTFRRTPTEDYAYGVAGILTASYRIGSIAAEGMANLPEMDDGERGAIIFTASVAAQDAQIGQVIYGSAKAGVNGLVLPMARDLMDLGIRVNSIMPGVFGTPLLGNMNPKVKESLEASVPFPKRLGKAEEYASLAMEMVRNTYFNGQAVRLDGAIRMAPR
ncbi:MAG: SDR family oxidoreductase [Sphingopyxis sp.]|uniref:SDR family oxidoreductase n=1 Tax=Sphingopyxis sp. TaxID=1908224 RepID=UPI0040360B86